MPVPWIIVVGLLWIVVVALAVLVAGLSSRLGNLTWVAPGAHHAVGSEGPFVVGPPVDVQLTLPAAMSKPAREPADVGEILLFLHGSCGGCRTFWDQLAGSTGLHAQLDGIRRQLVTDEEGEGIFTGFLMTDVVVQREDEISRRFEINASPYGLALDSDGFVRWSGVPHTLDDLLSMAKALRRPREELLHTVWSPGAPA